MKFGITLDYELFFGASVGSVDACMISPTEALIKILKPYDAKATFFVDAGYLVRSEELGVDLDNRSKVLNQLRSLLADNHEVQLHIHPHWEDSIFENGEWKLNTNRFKLSDFSQDKAHEIVRRYAETLNRELDIKVSAFRAGGWCIQPFSHFSEALAECGVEIDSTIFHGGFNESATHFFDFRESPQKASYRFRSDPCIEVSAGNFLELPIANSRVSPLFFWKMAFSKKLGGAKHSVYGDGRAISMSRKDMIRLLLLPSQSVVSIDGYKASLLDKSADRWRENHGHNAPMILIGHPKAFSDYSLAQLEKFIAKWSRDSSFMTINTIANSL